MQTINFTVNGKAIKLEIEPRELLLDVLRNRLNLKGTKKGCGSGECGACTVLVDGAPVNSCIYLVIKADGKEVVTVEGLGTAEDLDELQKAFVEHGALQCGFCGPGMLLSARALLNKNPHPSRAQIKEALAGNLCRCSGYDKIIKAIESVSNK